MAQTIVSVGERDAFGREIGEDTLKEMGWSGSATPPRQEPARTAPPPQWTKPPSAPAPAPAPTPTPPATVTPFDAGEAWSVGGGKDEKPAPQTVPPVQRYQGRRRRGSFSKLIFLMVVIVLVGAGAGALIQLGGDAVDRGQRALRDAIPTTVPTATPVAGDAAPASLYSTAAVRKALAKLPGGRVTILSLREDSLSATGKKKIVYMSADGSVTTVNSPTTIPGKAIKVDPAAPSRIARTLSKRSRSAIETMTLTSIVGPAQWNITLANGRRYTASANGTHVKRA